MVECEYQDWLLYLSVKVRSHCYNWTQVISTQLNWINSEHVQNCELFSSVAAMWTQLNRTAASASVCKWSLWLPCRRLTRSFVAKWRAIIIVVVVFITMDVFQVHAAATRPPGRRHLALVLVMLGQVAVKIGAENLDAAMDLNTTTDESTGDSVGTNSHGRVSSMYVGCATFSMAFVNFFCHNPTNQQALLSLSLSELISASDCR